MWCKNYFQPREDRGFIYYFIIYLLLHGYPESKKEHSFPSHILSHVFCRKSKAILNPKRNKIFHHIFYHMSFAGKARLSWIQKGTKFSITYFITCLLKEKQGYPESKKEHSFPSHILSHVFCRKSKAILNREGTKFSITYFIPCLLQEKQGYPESKKEHSFPSHILSHVFCRKSKAILNREGTKFSITWFITCLSQERNVILNPQRYSFREVISVPKVTLMIINLNTIS